MSSSSNVPDTKSAGVQTELHSRTLLFVPHNSIQIHIQSLYHRFVQQRTGYQRQASAIICAQMPVVQTVEPHAIQPIHILADMVSPGKRLIFLKNGIL